MLELESAQFAIALALAGITVATYWVNRRGEMRDLAGRLYVSSVEFDPNSRIEVEDAQPIILGPVAVTVHNAAATPVQNLHIYLFDWGSRGGGWRVRRHPKSWWTGECRGHCFIAALGPDARAEVEFESAEHRLLADPSFPPLVLVYADGRGAQWVRFPDGRLKWRPFWQPPHGPIGGVVADFPT